MNDSLIWKTKIGFNPEKENSDTNEYLGVYFFPPIKIPKMCPGPMKMNNFQKEISLLVNLAN